MAQASTTHWQSTQTDAIPYYNLCDFRFTHCSLWRILCVRSEAYIQHQGLWRLNPWSRWYDWSYGLSIHHGIFCLHVLPEVCMTSIALILWLTFCSFIAVYKASVGSVIETAITGLSPEQQMEVVKGLSKHLVNQGVINAKVRFRTCFPISSPTWLTWTQVLEYLGEQLRRRWY